MALVKFKFGFWAPSEKTYPDRLRIFSGRFYRAGEEVEWPDDMLDYLPKSAKIIKKDDYVAPIPEEKEEKVEALSNFDTDRLADAEEQKVREQAEKDAPHRGKTKRL